MNKMDKNDIDILIFLFVIIIINYEKDSFMNIKCY